MSRVPRVRTISKLNFMKNMHERANHTVTFIIVNQMRSLGFTGAPLFQHTKTMKIKAEMEGEKERTRAKLTIDYKTFSLHLTLTYCLTQSIGGWFPHAISKRLACNSPNSSR